MTVLASLLNPNPLLRLSQLGCPVPCFPTKKLLESGNSEKIIVLKWTFPLIVFEGSTGK